MRAHQINANSIFSPTNFKLILHRQFLPYVKNIGTPGFRRKVIELTPSTRIQTMRRIVDIMWQTSLSIYSSKKQAMAQGNEAVLSQIGSGKDIMSVLSGCSFSRDHDCLLRMA